MHLGYCYAISTDLIVCIFCQVFFGLAENEKIRHQTQIRVLRVAFHTVRVRRLPSKAESTVIIIIVLFWMINHLYVFEHVCVQQFKVCRGPQPCLWMSVTMAKRETGSTSPVVRQIDKQFLVCSICLDHFHNPKVLPCLHTFCER